MSHQFKKKYGQNFLSQPHILNKIIESANIDNKNWIEVGLGEGALTKLIIPNAKRYLGYEIDHSLKPKLTEFEDDNAKIIYGDFLTEVNLADITNYFNNEPFNLIGNLPYNVSSQIIFYYIAIMQMREAVIMVQKEVAERILAVPNTKKYNAFTVIIDYYCTKEKVMNVDKRNFFPVPKVDGTVVKLVKKEGLKRRIPFENFVKTIFHYKRKTILNNLLQTTDYSPRKVREVMNLDKWKTNIRAEQLNLDQIIDLFNDITT